jgi:rare lipoprotein A
MKDTAVIFLAFLCVLMFAALCVLIPDNTRLSYELREANEAVRVNADHISALADRLIYLEDAVTFETLASYYGEDHRGKRTASGAAFDPDEMTAASPWLPFGSRWTVTRIDTGASVTCTITDRGPHVRLGRGLDLSRAAAAQIGMLREGVVAVSMRPGE